MENAVRRFRQARGLGQDELARLCGVSRQTVSSVESGRTDPSTALSLALARALGCTVDELFWLESAELRARVVPSRHGSSRLAVAEVGGELVAHALAPDALGTAADAIAGPRGKLRALRPLTALRGNLLLFGCDPALGLLAAHLGDRQRLIWLQAGSTAALEALSRGEAHAAGAHLFDEESGEFNLPFARGLLPGRALVVVNLARWRAGLAVRSGIRGVPDLARRGTRIVNREPGSGARRLLDRHLAKHGIHRVSGMDTVLPSHAAVAQAVAMGAADAGVTTESAALAAGVRFVPLAEERSDLVLPLEVAREARGARLLDTLASGAFRRELGAVAAYEAGHCGDVVAEVHP